MKPYRLCSLFLGCLPLTLQALPQSVDDIAYPQEIYYARDFRFSAPQTLFDLLQQLPGVTIGWQADGQPEIQLHGLDGRYLSILINGQPLLGASGNNILATRQIPAALIDHVEIDRNTRADISMGGAAAGTINVVLSDAYGSDGLIVSAGGESLNNRVAAAVHLNNDEHPLRIAAEQRLYRYESDGETESDSRDGYWQAFNRELSRSLHLSYNTLLNDRHPLQLYAMHLQADSRDRLSGSYPLNRPSTLVSPDLRDVSSERHSERTSQRFGGNLRLNWSHLSLDAFFLSEQFDLDSHLSQTDPVAAEQTNQIDDSRYVIGWQLSETRNEHRWSLGLNVQQMKRTDSSLSDAILTSNSDRSDLPYNYDFKENRISSFILDRWQLTPMTEFEAGLHMDSYEISLDNDAGESDSGVATDTHWLPSFHLLHRLNSLRRLRISLSQSSREPEISDRVPYEFRQDNTLWRGNDDLDAELISNFDLGYEQNFRRPASALSDRNSGLYLRLFQRIINNAIYQAVDSETDDSQTLLTVFTPRNSSGNAILRGMELDLEFYPGIHDIRIEMGGGLYRSEMQAAGDLPQRYRLTNQPDYMARLGFQHQPLPGLRYGSNWRIQGSSEQLLPGDSGYVVQRTSVIQNLDIYAEYQWNASWHSLASVHLTPGPVPWQEQQDIRQYKDIQPLWQLTLIGVF